MGAVRVGHRVAAVGAVVLTMLVALLAAVTSEASVRDTVLLVTLPLGFTVAGAVVLRRQPRSVAAAALAAVGLLHLLAFALAGAAVLAARRGLDAVAAAAAAPAGVAYLLGFVALLTVATTLPARTTLTPALRRVLGALAVAAVAGPVLGALDETQRLVAELPGWPSSVPGTGAAPSLAHLGAPAGALLAAPLAAAVVVAVRWYRAVGAERRRLRRPVVVLALAVAALAVQRLVGADLPWELDAVLFVAALALLPLALLPTMLAADGEDDEQLAGLVRTAVVLSALWTVAAVLYALVATGLDLDRGTRSGVATVLVLLAGAAPLVPAVRAAVAHAADRIALGPAVDGYALLRDYGTLLAGPGGLDELCRATADTVRAALGATWVRLELTTGETGVAGRGEADAAASITVPVADGEAHLGALRCGPRRRGPYRERDREAVRLVARQAALGVRRAQLAAEVGRRLQELEASRHRLALAADEERRRIERDLHDGAQQDLVVLLSRVELARTLLGHSAEAAAEVLEELHEDVVRAIAALRRTVLGIHPAVLTDRGLLVAVAARARDLPIEVTVDAGREVHGRRFAPELEVAAYFVVVEGLTNVLKHAGVAAARVRLACEDGDLVVAVDDDGAGGAAMTGSGLSGLADRVCAVGGSLGVVSRPGAGTCVRARFPLDVPVPL
jgi:signal transduction histidine kinase